MYTNKIIKVNEHEDNTAQIFHHFLRLIKTSRKVTQLSYSDLIFLNPDSIFFSLLFSLLIVVKVTSWLERNVRYKMLVLLKKLLFTLEIVLELEGHKKFLYKISIYMLQPAQSSSQSGDVSLELALLGHNIKLSLISENCYSS